MTRQLFTGEQLERIYHAAVRVLGEMGMRVENRECLEAMERFGCTIDYPRERAVISPEVIARMLEIVRAEQGGASLEFDRFGASPGMAASGTCPFYYDSEVGRRRATEDDCIRMFKLAEACGVGYVGPSVSNSDCPARFEAIRCLQLGIETLNRSVAGGTDLFHPEQVPWAVELGLLYRNDPAWFLPAGNCPSSPLQIGKTIADLAVAKARYKQYYAVPTMPVLGANAPMTPAGTAVIGIAEILGGYVLAKSLNPETPVGATALSALMDMKSGSMVFVAPEVFAADLAIREVMQVHLQLPCRIYGVYVDAKLPGMRAIMEKLLKNAAIGLLGNVSTFDGSLDQGKLFAPAQMVLDHDIQRFLAASMAEPTVTDDELAVEAILEIGWDSTGYLMHDHTSRHMRETWQSEVFHRAHWVSLADELAKEAGYLERAEQTWRDRLSNYEPPDHSEDFLRELRAICSRAKEALA